MDLSNLLLRARPSEPASPDFAGVWKNQIGSVMQLSVEGQKLTGKYRSEMSGGGKPIEGELVGYADGDLIVFSVNWCDFGSLTTWAGQLVTLDGHECIKTLWHLALDVNDEVDPRNLWRSVLAGADDFTRAS